MKIYLSDEEREQDEEYADRKYDQMKDDKMMKEWEEEDQRLELSKSNSEEDDVGYYTDGPVIY